MEIELTRQEADDLLYVLDDADRMFSHHGSDVLLTMWQRLNHARCYRDGEQGFRGTLATRRLALSRVEAIYVRSVLTKDWTDSLKPKLRARIVALTDRIGGGTTVLGDLRSTSEGQK